MLWEAAVTARPHSPRGAAVQDKSDFLQNKEAVSVELKSVTSFTYLFGAHSPFPYQLPGVTFQLVICLYYNSLWISVNEYSTNITSY